MEPEEIREGYLVKKVRARTVLMILMAASLFPFLKVSQALVTKGLKEKNNCNILGQNIAASTTLITHIGQSSRYQDDNTRYWCPSIPWCTVSVAHQSKKPPQNLKCSTPAEPLVLCDKVQFSAGQQAGRRVKCLLVEGGRRTQQFQQRQEGVEEACAATARWQKGIKVAVVVVRGRGGRRWSAAVWWAPAGHHQRCASAADVRTQLRVYRPLQFPVSVWISTSWAKKKNTVTLSSIQHLHIHVKKMWKKHVLSYHDNQRHA